MIKIHRNPIPPISLAIEKQKAHGSYNEPDVIQQLKEDSNDKCYICELGGLSDPEVEHLRPHHGRKIRERVFDWNNLFYACPHCNNLKKEARYDDKIIDCCAEDPEKKLEQSYEEGKVSVHSLVDEECAVMTAELIQASFEKWNTGIRQAAALQVMQEFNGKIPADYLKLLSLKGVGEYTAGAIASIVFGIPEPAVDGNALRIFSRILAEDGEINKASVKKKISQEVRRVLPKERPGDFNQALMDLGSSICIPNGEPFCENCPWEAVCQAHKYGRETDFPVKAKKKKRKIEKKAVFLIEVSDKIILHKRPEKGLLSGLWELPNVDGELTAKELSEQMKKWGIGDYMIEPLGEGKHIFSHVEWQMRGYRLQMRDVSEKLLEKEEWIAVSREDLEEKYAIPSAFECYRKQIYRG